MKLLVGLGNPGKQYEKTRHNVGWMVLDELVKKQSTLENWSASKNAKAQYLKIKINNQDVELLKPTDFMNNSGFSVRYAQKKHNLKPEDIIVVHDDKDISLGEIKVQFDKNSAGHNGVQSIINHLKTKEFYRVRVGVAPENKDRIGDTAKFVLKKFGLFEKKKLNQGINKAVEEIEKMFV